MLISVFHYIDSGDYVVAMMLLIFVVAIRLFFIWRKRKYIEIKISLALIIKVIFKKGVKNLEILNNRGCTNEKTLS